MVTDSSINFKYLKSFYKILGSNLYVTILLSIVVTLFDSIGIGFLIGLTSSIFNSKVELSQPLDNQFTSFLSKLGIHFSSVYVILIMGISAFILKSFLYYFQLIYQAKNTNTIISKSRLNLIEGLQNLNYRKFIAMDFGRIQNVTTLEVLKLNSAMINYFSAIQFLFMALTYLAISFIVDYKISLIIVIFSGIFLLFLKQIKAYYHKLSLKVSASGDKYNSLLIQLLQNFKYLKLTHGFPHFTKRINYFIKAAEDKNYTILKTNAISVSLREPILLLLILGILVLYYYLNSEITTGALFSLALFYRTLNYIILTQTNFQMFTSFQGSIDNILTLQQELDLNKEDFTKGTDFNFAHELVFNNVSLKLQNKLILDQVDLTLNKFQTVGIVGRSGAGKTTLANTLSGILSPDDGNITVDGQDIRSINSALFRSTIGYVSQVPVIFNDSFFNNVTLWAEKTTAAVQKFENVIEIAQIKELIHGYSDREETIVGDNGIILSGGQKQRVSIARELYKSPQILIMDEATSSLDTQTENLIRQNIERLHGNITMLIIAHRLSTVENADIIYLIQDGRVLHSGTYEELLQNSTEFRNLAKYQDKMIE